MIILWSSLVAGPYAFPFYNVLSPFLYGLCSFSIRWRQTLLINKLHSIFNMNGVPEVKKADLEKNESRVCIIAERLEGLAFLDATMIEELITPLELKIV